MHEKTSSHFPRGKIPGGSSTSRQKALRGSLALFRVFRNIKHLGRAQREVLRGKSKDHSCRRPESGLQHPNQAPVIPVTGDLGPLLDCSGTALTHTHTHTWPHYTTLAVLNQSFACISIFLSAGIKESTTMTRKNKS